MESPDAAIRAWNKWASGLDLISDSCDDRSAPFAWAMLGLACGLVAGSVLTLLVMWAMWGGA